MPLFQKSVLNKYLKEQEKTAVEKAYEVDNKAKCNIDLLIFHFA